MWNIKMRKIWLYFVFVLILNSLVFADRGLGIIWNTNSEIVGENQDKCVSYGVFNPGDENVKASLEVSGELEQISSSGKTKEISLKAGTNKENAENVEICFNIGKVYKEDCILGTMCKQTCAGQEQIVYDGKVSLISLGTQGAGSGSSASFSIPATLSILVKCEDHERSYTAGIVGLAIVILFVISLSIFKGRRRAASK